MLGILVDWLLAFAHHPIQNLCGGLFLSAPPCSLSRDLLLSLIPGAQSPRSISLLFITFSCKIVKYTHIWLKLLIVAVLRNFCQAPWILPLTDAIIWDQHGTGTCHNTRPGQRQQIAIKSSDDLPVADHNCLLHRWEHVHKIHHAVSVENYFVLSYSIAIVSNFSDHIFRHIPLRWQSTYGHTHFECLYFYLNLRY